MGPQGPVCVSHFREPVYRYFRIPLCCPGFTMDRDGKCTIRVGQAPQTNRNNNQDMMSMAAQMRQAMWLRAKQDMKRRRAMFLMQMKDRMENSRRDNRRQPFFMPPMPHMQTRERNEDNRRQPFFMPPMLYMQMQNRMENSRRPPFFMPQMPRMQMRRPPMVPMFNLFNREQSKTQPIQPRVAFLRFSKPTPPMPHPVQKPPTGRWIKIIKRKMIPLFSFIQRPRTPFPENSVRSPMIPRIVLSARTSVTPTTNMPEFHPPMPPFPQFIAPRIEQPEMPPSLNNQEFPQDNFSQTPQEEQINGSFQPDGFHETHGHEHTEDFHVPLPKELEMASDNVMQVNLPNEPVQMPDLVVEQAPTTMHQDSCIVTLESAVKMCLKQNNIDVPDVMSAFEPFNDDKSRALCAAEDAIFNCISDAVKSCGQSNDAEIARDMLMETAKTVQSMCDLRQANMNGGATVPPDVTNQQPADTSASVENVDAVPTGMKDEPTPKTGKEEITIIENNAAPDAASAEAVKEAIQHEVHVQELRMKEYLLPILVGAGVGFMVLVLLMSLLICCCCKRRFHKRMKMAKEMEKPPLKDGIYTIGLPPPKYETNGIPPMYYEEAKGEKITSRSPSVLEGADQAKEEGDNTQM